MVCATELIRVFLPAQDKHLLLQPASLASNLSWRKAKSLDGALDKNICALR